MKILSESLQQYLNFTEDSDPIKDMELLSDARDCASKIINDDPYLDKYKNKIIKEHLYFWFQR